MNDKKLSTEPYKGVRDFYPAQMAVLQYIFDSWSTTAERFGFERYDTSILEPADLYKTKGAENEELVNEQTYTFTDRGDREVTLRPEMTPSVARLVAKKARELAFPLRWYSIPNLFRYERPQKGRLREHWQLNCDIFGSNHVAADIEVIALANQILLDFGATPKQFEIRINHRKILPEDLQAGAKKHGINLRDEQVTQVARLIDKIEKISADDFEVKMVEILGSQELSDYLLEAVRRDLENEVFNESASMTELRQVLQGLHALNITNVRIDLSLMRGFDYYTGTIFEIFEVGPDKRPTGRAMLGGGRYDNLTSMFGGEPISGIGFGMGDVTMQDFLETHNLIPETVHQAGVHVQVIPMSAHENIPSQAIAQTIRQAGFSASCDMSTRKLQKKISDAAEKGSKFICIIGSDEISSNTYTIKNLNTSEEQTGELSALMNFLSVE